MGLRKILNYLFPKARVTSPLDEFNAKVQKLTDNAKKLLSEGKVMQAQLYALQANYMKNDNSTNLLLKEIDTKCTPFEVKPGEVKIIPYKNPLPLSKRIWVCETKELPEDFLACEDIGIFATHLIIDTACIAHRMTYSADVGNKTVLGYKGLWDITSEREPVVGINLYIGEKFLNESIKEAKGMLASRRKKDSGKVEILIAKIDQEPTPEILNEMKRVFSNF